MSINTINTHREDSGNPAPALKAVARGRGAVRDSKLKDLRDPAAGPSLKDCHSDPV